jgi:hypothetical protein
MATKGRKAKIKTKAEAIIAINDLIEKNNQELMD